MKSHILRSLREPCQIAMVLYMRYNTHSIGRIVNPIVERISILAEPRQFDVPNMHKTLSLLIVNGWYPDLPENNYAIGSCPAPNLREVKKSEQ
jgi:hypothetical protein